MNTFNIIYIYIYYIIINNRNETQNKCIPIFSSHFLISPQDGNHLSRLYFSSCIVPRRPGHPRSRPIIKPLNQGRSCDWPPGP